MHKLCNWLIPVQVIFNFTISFWSILFHVLRSCHLSDPEESAVKTAGDTVAELFRLVTDLFPVLAHNS